VAVFALSYDPVPILARFAERNGITYTLLSDEGSHVIRRLGLENPEVAVQQSFYGRRSGDRHRGLPHPGTFVLDERGVVTEKWFEQAYRVRPTAAAVVESVTGRPSALPRAATGVEAGPLRVTARLNADAYRPYQKLRLEVTVEIAPGLHVYGEPIPEGFIPLSLAIDPLPGIVLGPPELSEPRPYRLEGLDEQFMVYEGTILAARDFILTENLGPITVAARIGYQACSATDCLPPGSVTVELRLDALEHVPPVSPP
jgi:hypothetical protein